MSEYVEGIASEAVLKISNVANGWIEPEADDARRLKVITAIADFALFNAHMQDLADTRENLQAQLNRSSKEESDADARLIAAAPELATMLARAVHDTDLTGEMWRKDALALLNRIAAQKTES